MTIMRDPRDKPAFPPALTEPSGFSLGFQQREDVSLAHRSLDVPDELSVLLVQEFHFDLRALSLRAGPAQDLHHSRADYGFFHDWNSIDSLIAVR